MFGVATYVSSDPEGALQTAPDGTPARDAFRQAAQDIVDRVRKIDAEVSKLRGKQAMAETSVDATEAKDQMIHLLNQREGLLQELTRTGRSFHDVAPVVTSAKNPADFRVGVVYKPDDPLVRVLQTAVGEENAEWHFDRVKTGVWPLCPFIL
jgi:hypothetical protein